MSALVTPRHCTTTRRRLWWLLLLINAAWLSVGCGPATLAMLILPWTDDKQPAEYKIASSDKEVSVAIMTTFGNLEVRPEVLPAEFELAEKLAMTLRKQFQDNKEKVKVLPPTQVRGIQSKKGALASLSPVEVAKELKADYVIFLEINSLSLYEKGGQRTLYRGNAEIAVSLYDMKQASGEHKVYERPYRSVYPGTRGPIDAGESSVSQFRALYLNRVASEVARLFTASPNEKFSMD